MADLDMFGHKINLNFNKEDGGQHTTGFTGFISLIIYCLMGFYVGLNIKKLVYNEADAVVSSAIPAKGEEFESINLFESGFNLFHIIRKQTAPEDMLSEIDKLYPFIDMHYQYVQADLTKTGSEGGYRVSKIPAKLCEIEDLGLSKEEAE